MAKTIRPPAKLQRALRQANAKPQEPIFGFLGDINGVVSVPDKPNFLFVTLKNGATVQAYNNSLPPAPLMPVELRIDPRNPSYYHLVGARDVFATDYPYPLMKSHAPSHTWPGYDAPPIHKRQLLPGMVTATGLLVTCQSDFVLTDAGILAYFPGAQLDISSSVPTSGARYVLISINSSTLALTATDGSIVDYAALTYASIPSTPAGHKREAAIRLVAGQTAIRERDSGDTDILDLRFLDPNALLTSAQVTDLTDSGDTTLHYHAADRDLANAINPTVASSAFKSAALSAAPAETVNTVGALINGSTATTTLADTALFTLAISSVLRSLTWANLKSAILAWLVPGHFREKLTANRVYYVRPDGNDSQTGLLDTAGGAFLTPQKAIDVIATTLDISGYQAKIKLADGTYPPFTLKNVSGFAALDNLVIEGNTTTPSNVVISATGSVCITAQSLSSVWTLKDFRLTGNVHGIVANNSTVVIDNIDFHTITYFQLFLQSAKAISRGYSISGNAGFSNISLENSYFESAGTTVKILANITLGTFIYCNYVSFSNSYGMSFDYGAFAVTATVRYSVAGNGVLFTNGGGPTFFPGDTDGVELTGGKYI